VARLVRAHGGKVLHNTRVLSLQHDHDRLSSVGVRQPDGSKQTIAGDYVLSSMPIAHLIAGLTPQAPHGQGSGRGPALLRLHDRRPLAETPAAQR